MAGLSAPLIVEVLDKERSGLGVFRLVEDFTADTSIGPITVPADYKTDLASIPRIARWILPQCGKSAKAALLHDWLLHLDDKRATGVFSEALKASGCGAIRRWAMVAFVFVFTFSDLHWGA